MNNFEEGKELLLKVRYVRSLEFPKENLHVVKARMISKPITPGMDLLVQEIDLCVCDEVLSDNL